jgi:hypothetical protein
VANGARRPLHWALCHFDHLVDGEGIALGVASLHGSSLPGHRNLLADISNFHIDDLTLLIYHFQVIFMNLQHKAQVFHAVVIDKVIRSILAVSTLIEKTSRG